MKLCEYLKAVENDAEKLAEFNDIICEAIQTVEIMCPHLYQHTIYKLHCLAYGEQFTEDIAQEAVAEFGEHWTLEDTTVLANKLGVENVNAFYVIMNYLYTNFYNVLGVDANMYAKMAKALLDSESESAIFKFYMMT